MFCLTYCDDDGDDANDSDSTASICMKASIADDGRDLLGAAWSVTSTIMVTA